MSEGQQIQVTVREVGSAPIENVTITPNPNGPTTLDYVMGEVSRYHGAKDYTGKQLMMNGVEAGTGTVVDPGQHEIIVGDDVVGGPRKD